MKRFPGDYEKHRVFFADEKKALPAGYHPCGKDHTEHISDPAAYKARFEL